jgi:hypothetical protein
MTSKKFALVGGMVMLILGVTSLIPALSGSPSGLPTLKLTTSYGLFLGVLPLNILNKIGLIFLGIAGIYASRMENKEIAIYFSRTICVVMGILALLGISPTTDTLFGYSPLFGTEILINTLFALLGGYCGFILDRPQSRKQIHA